jgi:hypothetical protein
MPIIADRYCACKCGRRCACTDIEQNRVRNAIVSVARYRCPASLQKNFRRMVNAATKSCAKDLLPLAGRFR